MCVHTHVHGHTHTQTHTTHACTHKHMHTLARTPSTIFFFNDYVPMICAHESCQRNTIIIFHYSWKQLFQLTDIVCVCVCVSVRVS